MMAILTKMFHMSLYLPHCNLFFLISTLYQEGNLLSSGRALGNLGSRSFGLKGSTAFNLFSNNPLAMS